MWRWGASPVFTHFSAQIKAPTFSGGYLLLKIYSVLRSNSISLHTCPACFKQIAPNGRFAFLSFLIDTMCVLCHSGTEHSPTVTLGWNIPQLSLWSGTFPNCHSGTERSVVIESNEILSSPNGSSRMTVGRVDLHRTVILLSLLFGVAKRCETA